MVVRGGLLLGGPKERKARKASQKAMMAFRRVGFRPYLPDQGAGKDYTQNKGKGKDRKRKRQGGAYPQSGLSASENTQ